MAIVSRIIWVVLMLIPVVAFEGALASEDGGDRVQAKIGILIKNGDTMYLAKSREKLHAGGFLRI
ncbi:MAG: hypothetical protein V2B19_32875 [Pseudomonadota bacterium]